MMEKVIDNKNKLVDVPSKSQIRVDWQDYPENRTIESVSRVKHISLKNMEYLRHL